MLQVTVTCPTNGIKSFCGILAQYGKSPHPALSHRERGKLSGEKACKIGVREFET
jgi:hypothetical protein